MGCNSPHGSTDAEYERLVRLNQLCDQFETGWKCGGRPEIEDLLRENPDIERAEILTELLPLEVELRGRRGEQPQADEYLARFPENHGIVEAAFQPAPGPVASDGEKTMANVEDRIGPKTASRASMLPIYTVIGDYELLEEVGRGGMGVVYRARQISLDRIVALKMILSGEFADQHEVQRFRSEARAAASLEHPNVVAIYEVGEEAGRHYFSMGFVDGQSLSKTVAGGPLPPREAAALIEIVAETIEYAHSQGIVHRDLKPGNVLIDGAGQPHVTDFGLARQYEVDSHLTSTGQVLGTPSFMPPEQAINDSAAIGPASDVYSLGALLYTLLTGRPPFQAANFVETLNQVLEREPVAPRLLNPVIPRDLETICLKCLEKAPAQRCSSAAELAAELGRFLRQEPIHMRPIGVASRFARWCRRRKAWAALIAVSTVAIMAFAVELFLHDRHLSELNDQLVDKAADAQTAREAAERDRQHAHDMLYVSEMRRAFAALKDSDTRTLTELLNRSAPGATSRADRRGFECFFLRRRADAPRQTWFEGGGPVYVACYSPRGGLLAAAGKDAIVRIFDTRTGELAQQIATSQIEVNGVAFSPDEGELATAGDDGSVRFWNTDTGHQRLMVPKANAEKAFQIVFLPGGLLACCGENPVIGLFDVQTGDRRGQLAGHERTVQSLALGQDGRTLVSTSSDSTAILWDLETRSQIGKLQGLEHLGPVAIDTNRDLIVTGADKGEIQTWRITSGEPLSSARHLDSVSSLALHPVEELLAAGDKGGGIRLWKLNSHGGFADSEPRTWHAHRGTAQSLAWSDGGGQLTSAGDDGRVLRWDIPNEPAVTRIHFDNRRIADFALIPGSPRFARVGGQGIEIWDWRQRLIALKFDTRTWVRVATSAMGIMATWGFNGELAVWNISEGKPISQRNYGGATTGFALSPGGGIVAASRGNRRTAEHEGERSVCLYDTQTAQLVAEVEAPSCAALAYSSDGRLLAIEQVIAPGLMLWDVAQKRMLWRAPQSAVKALAFSPDGKLLAAAGDDRAVIVWDVETGTARDKLLGHRHPILSLAFSPDGRTLASGGHDGAIKLWHVATGQELFELHVAEAECRKLEFTDDGLHLAAQIANDDLLVFHAD